MPRHRPRRFSPGQDTAGRGRARRRFGRCRRGVAASRASKRASARRSSSVCGRPRHRRRRAGLSRCAGAGHARHRRAAIGAAFAAAAAGGAGQSRCGAPDQGGLCRMAAGCGAGRGARPRGGCETDRPRSAFAIPRHAVERSGRAGHRAQAGHRRSSCGAAQASRMPTGPHVRLGATCFGLFATSRQAPAARKGLARQISTWVGESQAR